MSFATATSEEARLVEGSMPEPLRATMQAIRRESPLREDEDADARRARVSALKKRVRLIRAAWEEAQARCGGPGDGAIEEAVAQLEREMQALHLRELSPIADKWQELAGASRPCRKAADRYAAAVRRGLDQVEGQTHGRPEFARNRIVRSGSRVATAFGVKAACDQPGRRRTAPRPRARHTGARRVGGSRSGTSPPGGSDDESEGDGDSSSAAARLDLDPWAVREAPLGLWRIRARRDLAQRCATETDRELTEGDA